MNIYRIKKIENEIKKKICLILLKNINDNRIKNIDITYTKLSKDLTQIKIFVLFNYKNNINNIVNILNKASNFIRKKLFLFFSYKNIPKIKFSYDYYHEKKIHLVNIINNLKYIN